MALSFPGGFAMWMKLVPSICIHCDSKSAIGRTHSHMYNGKSRHIR